MLDKFKHHEKERFKDKLKDKLRVKSYYEKRNGFNNAVKAIGHLASLFSVSSAGFAAYWVGLMYTGNQYVSFCIGFVVLLALEYCKHYSSDAFWDDWFFENEFSLKWSIAVIAIFFISLGTSALGGNKGSETLATPPDVIKANETTIEKKNRIAQLESENIKIDSLPQYRNHLGELYHIHTRTKNDNKKMIATLQEDVDRLNLELEGKNYLLEEKHKSNVGLAKWITIIFIILLEIVFELSKLYNKRFEYKVSIDENIISKPPKNSPPTPPRQKHKYDKSKHHQNSNSKPLDVKKGSLVSNQSKEIAKQAKESKVNNSKKSKVTKEGSKVESKLVKVWSNVKSLKSKPFSLKESKVSKQDKELDLVKLVKDCRNHYKLAYTSSTNEAKDRNRKKYLSEIIELRKLGYLVEQKDNTRLIISLPKDANKVG